MKGVYNIEYNFAEELIYDYAICAKWNYNEYLEAVEKSKHMTHEEILETYGHAQ